MDIVSASNIAGVFVQRHLFCSAGPTSTTPSSSMLCEFATPAIALAEAGAPLDRDDRQPGQQRTSGVAGGDVVLDSVASEVAGLLLASPDPTSPSVGLCLEMEGSMGGGRGGV
ncbi:hypothetical protein TRIUR3_26850 [Triticum urartu]|uniref:Uncharacterized protein n=1 Tax=Triticum urartu TaxID=4572 RepID=M7ZPB9_TRIUA|nr:hypothetical protein TRIUR3_26850 [Triticum urartu]